MEEIPMKCDCGEIVYSSDSFLIDGKFRCQKCYEKCRDEQEYEVRGGEGNRVFQSVIVKGEGGCVTDYAYKTMTLSNILNIKNKNRSD